MPLYSDRQFSFLLPGNSKILSGENAESLPVILPGQSCKIIQILQRASGGIDLPFSDLIMNRYHRLSDIAHDDDTSITSVPGTQSSRVYLIDYVDDFPLKPVLRQKDPAIIGNQHPADGTAVLRPKDDLVSVLFSFCQYQVDGCL